MSATVARNGPACASLQKPMAANSFRAGRRSARCAARSTGTCCVGNILPRNLAEKHDSAGVRGHEMTPTGGQVEVSILAGGSYPPCVLVSISYCGPHGDGEGADQLPSRRRLSSQSAKDRNGRCRIHRFRPHSRRPPPKGATQPASSYRKGWLPLWGKGTYFNLATDGIRWRAVRNCMSEHEIREQARAAGQADRVHGSGSFSHEQAAPT